MNIIDKDIPRRGTAIKANYIGERLEGKIGREVQKIVIERDDFLGFIVTLENGRKFAFETIEELRKEWESSAI